MRSAGLVFLMTGALTAADPIVSAFKARYQTAKLNFVESADAMPAEAME